jgi:hypothetical protein
MAGLREGDHNMDTVGIDEVVKLLPDLHFVGPCWSGHAFVPFWGETLEVNLDLMAEGQFSPWQVEVLKAILRYPHDLRGEFEQRLFAYYQKDVYDCIEFLDEDGTDVSDECAPRMDEPGQIWTLIEGPEVYIHCCFRSEPAIAFELAFTCTWDDEHGLGVRYRDWQIEYIGGWGG